MALVAPKLDDRTFQDIVDEAKKRIPHYCKEWTDHNVSDPGVTLIELFAWMTDIVLYRMNQVPDLHYLQFMEMMGTKLQEPVPACAPVKPTAAGNRPASCCSREPVLFRFFSRKRTSPRLGKPPLASPHHRKITSGWP